jgi:hypothetical protein
MADHAIRLIKSLERGEGLVIVVVRLHSGWSWYVSTKNL